MCSSDDKQSKKITNSNTHIIGIADWLKLYFDNYKIVPLIWPIHLKTIYYEQYYPI